MLKGYCVKPFINQMPLKTRILYLMLGILSPFLIAGYALFCIWIIGLIVNFAGV